MTMSKKETEEKQADAETSDAAEYGERIETGKAIHRGGKDHGHVPGAVKYRERIGK